MSVHTICVSMRATAYAGLGSELVGRDGHALVRSHLELSRGQLGVEDGHEGHRLALVPSVQQVQRSGEEDRAHCVHHAL